MVDLAGLEELKKSGAEAKSIGKSLSALGNVIKARLNKESPIPYGNSKLTFLLQKALGDSGFTQMIVNVSPKESCIDETIDSLKFAAKNYASERVPE